MKPIERVPAPSAEVFRARYVERSRPVILTGALEAWPARSRWNAEFFRSEFGDRTCPAIRNAPGEAQFDPRAGMHYEPVRLGDYVDAVEAESTAHYLSFALQDHLPELLNDIVRPPYCASARWFRSRLWYGASGIRGPLHRDLPENLYAQISGRKRFVLVDKREGRKVYAYPPYSGVPNYAKVDAESPDLGLHPRFQSAERLVADLEPGDLLYIPSLWWHQARTVSTSLSVNLWWADGLRYAVVRAAEIFMKVRGLKL